MKNLFIGIDFAAKKFDVAVIYAEGLQEQAPAEYNQFENTDEGFKACGSSPRCLHHRKANPEP